ncbi:MAG: DinB family protein [Anaerolineae bacterium]|nr:DinB family protein [Anaerolineae bacterium]
MPKASPAEIRKQVALLEETPQRISQYVAGRDEAQLTQTPTNRDWSAVEILAHLRSCEEIWTFSIYAMLTEDQPTLPLLDERRWAKTTLYSTLGFADSFQAFTLKRAELLRVLRNLPEDAWLKTANIGGRNHSVFSQVRRMALHEAEHCEQFAALLK